jgi:hypothetical protein
MKEPANEPDVFIKIIEEAYGVADSPRGPHVKCIDATAIFLPGNRDDTAQRNVFIGSADVVFKAVTDLGVCGNP